ncbi:hypothetical protein J5N97_002843 [Dioscorea zingiberensis]|uniref:Uncharacterized protein n=1 Tax=Dioscorea zingiberensis TaxID=325984 RepID=A0A9D5D4V3_9LILI|nr:hypothetical protein J5N97_002843 [Dioscorea zingiberensis]
MVVHGHGVSHPLEVVGTVVEVADVAWHALEHGREQKLAAEQKAVEIAGLRSENIRLRTVLAENLTLLQTLLKGIRSDSSDCPPDFYERLLASVNSMTFLAQLELLHQESTGFPVANCTSKEELDVDLNLVNGDQGDPSRWVWITHELTSGSSEEVSGIDDENYVIIDEENVVDGISAFIARCIIANPKSKRLNPEELQKVIMIALGDIKNHSSIRKIWEAGKLLYKLSTWGVALSGLYRYRAILTPAARCIGASGKIILKVL